MAALRSEPRRSSLRAVAVCATGYAACPETGEQSRAILISFESSSGEARTVAIPYVRGLMDSVVYHEAIEQPGRLVVFAEAADSSG